MDNVTVMYVSYSWDDPEPPDPKPNDIWTGPWGERIWTGIVWASEP